MRPQVEHIAITMADGSLAIMQFVTKSNFDRTATDDAIEAEIARAGIAATSWRRITPDEIPVDRADRDAWRDTGKTIAIDPVRKGALDRARAAIRDPLAEIDALKARITAGVAKSS
jgi:hypothetical protein